MRADSLGTRAIPLHALLGRVDARRVCPDPGLAAALSLVTDVHHLNGGRQVTLRSVFRLQVWCCDSMWCSCNGRTDLEVLLVPEKMVFYIAVFPPWLQGVP